MHDIIPFDEWIKGQDRGVANDEATLAIPQVVEAVSILRKKGKVILEITVDPAGDTGRNVEVSVKVVAKPPEAAPTPSIYFVGDNGSLHREDPYQQRLDVEPPVHIDAETGEVLNPKEK